MAFVHRALEQEEMGAAAWKAVGPAAPAPVRGMVARGLAPLPPLDLLVALYQLWCTNDEQHAEQAAKTIEGLPSAILDGALADAGLHPGVLDFMARKLVGQAESLDKVVRHPNVDDQTLAGIARVCPETVCDTLAENQVRWLAYPPILESLYQNPNCRMSVVHRMLELAVREGIDVRLPNMEEIRAAIAEEGGPDPERDEVFRTAARAGAGASHEREVLHLREAAVDDELDLDAVRVSEGHEEEFDLEAMLNEPEGWSLPLEDSEGADDDGTHRRVNAVQFSKLRPMEKMRLALMGDQVERAMAIRDSNRAVALSAIKSPRVKENEVVAYAANRTLSHDVVRYIARRRDWTKLYAVKLNLVMNPKTPMAAAMTLIGHLHGSDVKKVAHSKNIPSALATAAKRKLAQRR